MKTILSVELNLYEPQLAILIPKIINLLRIFSEKLGLFSLFIASLSSIVVLAFLFHLPEGLQPRSSILLLFLDRI